MYIKDIFTDVFKGLRIEKSNDETLKKNVYLIDTKDVEGCRIHFSKSGLQEICMDVKDKYYLQPGDIIIATVPSERTCHVGFAASNSLSSTRAIIKKNFIVLRGCSSLYQAQFVADYLETIGIYSYFENHKIKIDEFDNRRIREALTIEDIKNIKIPKISLDKQNDLLDLIDPINERNALYYKLMENDFEIKKHIINEVIEDEE